MVTEQIIQKINKKENFILKGGAGSGKTYTLVEVIEKLIDLNKYVVVITYTNVAKEEVIERLLKKGKKIFFCGTIHEFSWNNISKFQKELNDIIKKKYHKEIDYDKTYNIIYDFGFHRIDHEKLNISITHDEVLEFFLQVINDNVELYSIISNMYDCILVDEYQDTKQEVIDILLDEKMTISCGFFGDLVQSIYKDEELKMKDTKIISKSDNWRSSQKLVDFFNEFRRDLNGDDIIQVALNEEINDFESNLLYYEVDKFDNEIKRKIEEDNGFKLNHSLFLTHNLGLSNQVTVERSYNREFDNNQRKFGREEELYPHLNFLYDLYEMKCGNIFETIFVEKYFQVILENKEMINEWENEINNIKCCTNIKDIKDFKFFNLLDKKIREDIYKINDNMEIEYFNRMFIYGLASSDDATIFSMKGLEADNILVYINNGNWRKYNFKDLKDTTKKILYVSITRARKNLVLVSDKDKDIDENLKSIISRHFIEKKL